MRNAPGVPTYSPGRVALRRGRVSIAGQIYMVTATTQERERFFLNFSAACAASCCFSRAVLLGDAIVLAWILMPDHAHWLVQLGECKTLPAVINALKSASARDVNKALGRRGAVWARSFHDHALRSDEDVLGAARYIVANPVRAGLVPRVGEYPFWDAVWLPTTKSRSP